jgi:hypothetical protein
VETVTSRALVLRICTVGLVYELGR